MQFAFIKLDGVYSGDANIANLNPVQRLADFLQVCWVNVLAYPSDIEMRGERVFFLFVAQAGCACFNVSLQVDEVIVPPVSAMQTRLSCNMNSYETITNITTPCQFICYMLFLMPRIKNGLGTQNRYNHTR